MLNILGPSGVGKGTLINKLISEFGDKIKFSISHTTRKARENEKDSINYYFTSVEDFKSLIEKDGFIEHANYNGNYYGTSKQELQDKLELCKKQNSICLLELDIVGAKNLNKLNIGVEFIAIVPKNFDDLKNRLIKRGTDSQETIDKRLSIGKKELEEINSLDFIENKIVNDDLDICFNELKEVLKKKFPDCFGK